MVGTALVARPSRVPVDHRCCSPRLRRLALAWALIAAWPFEASAAAPPVRLEAVARVDLPAEDRPAFEIAVLEAARQGAIEAGVTAQADASARVVIAIGWKDERRLDYTGRIEVYDPGTPSPLAARSFACELCGASDLMTRVQGEVAAALGAVTWPEPTPEPAPAATTSPTATGSDRPEAPRRAPLRPMGWAGVGTASAGVVAAVVGAVLWTRDDRLVLRPDDAEGPVWVRSVRPAGIGLVAGGAAAVLVGGTLLAIDLTRDRRRDVAVQPIVAPGLVGLGVGGRLRGAGPRAR